MNQQNLLTQLHVLSHRMQIAMHITELMSSRNVVEKRQAVSAWARVVKDDLQDKLRRGV